MEPETSRQDGGGIPAGDGAPARGPVSGSAPVQALTLEDMRDLVAEALGRVAAEKRRGRTLMNRAQRKHDYLTALMALRLGDDFGERQVARLRASTAALQDALERIERANEDLEFQVIRFMDYARMARERN